MSKTANDRDGFTSVKPAGLLDKVKTLKEEGCRFYHMFADESDNGFDIVYIFAGENNMENFKVHIDKNEPVDSITFIFSSALPAELDMAEHSGIEVRHMSTEEIEGFYRAERYGASIKTFKKDVEMMSKGKDLDFVNHAVERMGTADSFGNSMGFCMAAEKAMGIKIPERAEYIRVIIHELSRIQLHFMWLSEVAAETGFESLRAVCLNAREKVISLIEKVSGARVILSMCGIGGVKRDLSSGMLDEIKNVLPVIYSDAERLAEVFCADRSLRLKLDGLGYIEEKDAVEICSGVTAKGSGVAVDARNDEEFPLYEKLGFEPVVENKGDGFSRCKVKLEEILQSVAILEKAVDQIPQGEIMAEGLKPGKGAAAVRVELSEGQALYYVRTSENGTVLRLGIKTAEEMNMPAFAEILKNDEIDDISLAALTVGVSADGIRR